MVRRVLVVAGCTLLLTTAARAQVPARGDACPWRGFELSWGRWPHRLGELESAIVPVGDVAHLD